MSSPEFDIRPGTLPSWATSRALHARESVTVAAQGDEVVGYCVMLSGPDVDEVSHIEVKPSHRRRGIAGALLQKVRGSRPVQLEVRESNRAARALYASMGFIVDGMRPRYYPTVGGGREDAVLMTWTPRASG